MSDREHYGVQDHPHPSAPPFFPGDLIVPIAHPGTGAVTVDVVAIRPDEGWRVGYRSPGGVTGSAPAERFVLAPEGWCDRPHYPAGRVRFGLSHADLQIAQEEDAADAALQRARREWREAVFAWNERWGNHPVLRKARGEA